MRCPTSDLVRASVQQLHWLELLHVGVSLADYQLPSLVFKPYACCLSHSAPTLLLPTSNGTKSPNDSNGPVVSWLDHGYSTKRVFQLGHFCLFPGNGKFLSVFLLLGPITTVSLAVFVAIRRKKVSKKNQEVEDSVMQVVSLLASCRAGNLKPPAL